MPSLYDPASLTLVFQDADNTVALSGNVLVQVRRGELTRATLERIETEARLLRAKVNGPTAALIVLTEGAGFPSGEVREIQQRVIEDMLRHKRTCAVVVLEGGGVALTVMRTVARAASPRHGRMKVAPNVAGAAEFLSEHVSRPVDELMALVEHVRSL